MDGDVRHLTNGGHIGTNGDDRNRVGAADNQTAFLAVSIVLKTSVHIGVAIQLLQKHELLAVDEQR